MKFRIWVAALAAAALVAAGCGGDDNQTTSNSQAGASMTHSSMSHMSGVFTSR